MKSENYEKITGEYTVAKVKAHPAFQGFENFLLGASPDMKHNLDHVKLKELSKVAPSWGIQDIIDGLNHLIDLREQQVPVGWDLWDEAERAENEAKQNTKLLYLPGSERDQPFQILCAGGSYRMVASMMEAFPVAKRLNELGYTVFVLSYRVGHEDLLPDPQEDLCRCVRLILEQHKQFHVSTENYGVMGFSAGGHLVAEYGTENLGFQNMDLPAPASLTLAYPLLTFTLPGDFEEDFARKITKDYMQPGDIEVIEHIGREYPPVYLWHCEDDGQVSIENSLRMHRQLLNKGIPNNMKRVTKGGHGLGLGTGSEAEGWVEEAVNFWIKHWK